MDFSLRSSAWRFNGIAGFIQLDAPTAAESLTTGVVAAVVFHWVGVLAFVFG